MYFCVKVRSIYTIFMHGIYCAVVSDKSFAVNRNIAPDNSWDNKNTISMYNFSYKKDICNINAVI